MDEQTFEFFKLANPFVRTNWPGWSVDTHFTLGGKGVELRLLCRSGRDKRYVLLLRERALREVAAGELSKETKRAFAEALGTDDAGPRQVDRF